MHVKRFLTKVVFYVLVPPASPLPLLLLGSLYLSVKKYSCKVKVEVMK